MSNETWFSTVGVFTHDVAQQLVDSYKAQGAKAIAEQAGEGIYTVKHTQMPEVESKDFTPLPDSKK